MALSQKGYGHTMAATGLSGLLTTPRLPESSVTAHFPASRGTLSRPSDAEATAKRGRHPCFAAARRGMIPSGGHPREGVYGVSTHDHAHTHTHARAICRLPRLQGGRRPFPFTQAFGTRRSAYSSSGAPCVSRGGGRQMPHHLRPSPPARGRGMRPLPFALRSGGWCRPALPTPGCPLWTSFA